MKEITFDDLRQLLLYRRIVKWNDDRIELDNGVKIRICVNADCLACADYCPVANYPGVCKYEERGDSDAQKGKRQTGAK